MVFIKTIYGVISLIFTFNNNFFYILILLLLLYYYKHKNKRYVINTERSYTLFLNSFLFYSFILRKNTYSHTTRLAVSWYM